MISFFVFLDVYFSFFTKYIISGMSKECDHENYASLFFILVKK